MPKRRWKRHRPEQIARKFRDVDVRLSTEQGTCGRACNMGISEAMYHCCRTQDGMKPKETKRSKELGDEKRKFRKIVADGLTADGRSDRYSRGVIVYERLTEERPFRGHHRRLLQQVLHGEPPSPPREWSAAIRQNEGGWSLCHHSGSRTGTVDVPVTANDELDIR